MHNCSLVFVLTQESYPKYSSTCSQMLYNIGDLQKSILLTLHFILEHKYLCLTTKTMDFAGLFAHWLTLGSFGFLKGPLALLGGCTNISRMI